MRQALRPGGVLVVEDIDFAGSFCHPPCAAYQRYVGLYRAVVLRRKAIRISGRSLHGLLAEAACSG
jgi:predicted O-methyltransferase YrrM